MTFVAFVKHSEIYGQRGCVRVVTVQKGKKL